MIVSKVMIDENVSIPKDVYDELMNYELKRKIE
jgi:hypothetical protein